MRGMMLFLVGERECGKGCEGLFLLVLLWLDYIWVNWVERGMEIRGKDV